MHNNLLISHIALYVSDLEKSFDFYGKLLQLKNIPEPFKDGQHAWFQIGPQCQLHLIEGNESSVQHHINHHIAFTTTDIENLISRLRNRGVVFRDPFGKPDIIHTRPDGIQQIFFQDPDGYWLEVNNEMIDER